MTEKKRPGRPRNENTPNIASADRVIARTVHTLSSWGFPQRSVIAVDGKNVPGIFEMVGVQARSIRTDHEGRPIGDARVKEIYAAWLSTERHKRHSDGTWPLLKRSRYLKHSLRQGMPHQARRLAMSEVIDLLLRNGGQSPWPAGIGERQLSPKEAQKKGVLKEQAVEELERRLMRLWIAKHGPIDSNMADWLRQLFIRAIALAYRADALGDAPESLKNGLEK